MSADKEIQYLRLSAEFARTLSKDRSTQVGAFFLHPTEFTVLTMGYNGIPRGCDDDEPSRHERPLKYEFFEHAERNAIYNALRHTFRDCEVFTNVTLDVDDVRAIISIGARALHSLHQPSSTTAKLLLREAKVTWHPLRAALGDNAVRFEKDGQELVSEPLHPLIEALDESPVLKKLFHAARGLLSQSTVVLSPLPPCFKCAKAIAAVGASKVVTGAASEELIARWGTSLSQTRGLFSSLGIPMREIPADSPALPSRSV